MLKSSKFLGLNSKYLFLVKKKRWLYYSREVSNYTYQNKRTLVYMHREYLFDFIWMQTCSHCQREIEGEGRGDGTPSRPTSGVREEKGAELPRRQLLLQHGVVTALNWLCRTQTPDWVFSKLLRRSF